MENSGLNFRKFPVMNGTEFSGISGKEDNLARVYPNFRKFLTGNLIFLPKFPEFSVEWFTFRIFNNFQIFWKLSQKISVPFVPVWKFSEFLVEWKAP